MYSFLCKSKAVEAAPKGADAYEFFTYDGPAVKLDFRGTDTVIKSGQRFGVRPSSNGKFIRLVLPDNINRVHTISLDQAKKLARGVRSEGR